MNLVKYSFYWHVNTMYRRKNIDVNDFIISYKNSAEKQQQINNKFQEKKKVT